MKSEILHILRNQEGSVSGQELCQRFGVSRTAVWKAIKQLKEEGYEIEAVPSKGYRILQCPDLVSAEEVGSRLDTVWAGRELYYEDTLDSTNNKAKELAEKGCTHGTLILAEKQVTGRGRRGRVWQTPPSSCIAMSLVLRPQLLPGQASMLTLVMGMAVAAACEECTGIPVGIKWPNDGVIGGKKVSGILTEMSAEIQEIHYLVTGVGINVNLTEFPEEIKETATSLRLEAGKRIRRSSVICQCMKKFERYYEKFMETGDLSGLLEEYHSLLVHKDQMVKVLDPKETYAGICRGINQKGELLVEKADHTITKVYAGEVSVRGLLGYV